MSTSACARAPKPASPWAGKRTGRGHTPTPWRETNGYIAGRVEHVERKAIGRPDTYRPSPEQVKRPVTAETLYWGACDSAALDAGHHTSDVRAAVCGFAASMFALIVVRQIARIGAFK